MKNINKYGKVISEIMNSHRWWKSHVSIGAIVLNKSDYEIN